MRRELVCGSGGVGALAAAPLPAHAPRGDASMTIRLRPSEPGVGDDLASFLCRHECRAEVAEDGTVVVELPHVIHQEQARMELELYIRLWQALRGISVRVDLLH